MAYIKTLQFEDIKLRLIEGQLTENTHKVITISANQQCFKTKTPSIVLNANTIMWKEKLIVRIGSEKQLNFQITDLYQFGYDPERLKRIMSGTMRVYTDKQKQRNWDVLDSNQKKIGVLTALVSDQFHTDNPHSTVMIASKLDNKLTVKPLSFASESAEMMRTIASPPPTKHFVTIHSIISNLQKPVVGLEGAYVTVKAGSKQIKTSVSKGGNTHHVWVDTLKMLLQQHQHSLEFTIVGYEGIDQQILCVGELSLEIFSVNKRVVSQRVEMKNSNGVIGEIFVDIKCTSESERDSTLQEVIIRRAKHSTIDARSHHTIQQKRSHERYALSPQSNSPWKPSVVIPNNSIIFSRQRRFQDYVDKKSPIVSYIKGDLQSTRSSHYRGASIGYGSKEDFTRQQKKTPGVGEYRLPSIWDRY